MKAGGFAQSLACAVRGIRHALSAERNMKFHLAATVMVTACGFAFRLKTWEWLAVVFAISLVWVTEMLNSAMEEVVDMVSPAYSVKAKNAKDMAAGAVLAAAINSVIIGLIVFAPHLLKLLGEK